MTDRVEKLLKLLKSGEYKKMRAEKPLGLYDTLKDTELFCEALKNEKALSCENDRIGFFRYNPERLGRIGNFVPNYSRYLSDGFGGVYNQLKNKYESSNDKQKKFITNAMKCLEAVFEYCERVRENATGELKEALKNIPYNPPSSYYEALVMMKIIIFTLRLGGAEHVTFGRFDQYMYPFYEADIKRGVSREEILELTEEFFISVNFDADIYSIELLGDNGQSMVLGGFSENGTSMYNQLSDICMDASLELNLIDPKINLRVGKNTPSSVYEKGTLMTKQGLGFPQYLNDDVVIPGLISLGYDKKDAYNYAVAACWEVIVPDVAFDIPNIHTMNFPKVINEAVHEKLEASKSFSEFMTEVKKKIKEECNELLRASDEREYPENVYFSLFFDTSIDNCCDYRESVKYMNYGFHGAGIANATDALTAVKKAVFEDKTVPASELVKALKNNFDGFSDIRHILIECPKMGNNDDYVDLIASEIMETFSEYLSTLKNKYGGIIRAGTGSAHMYIWSAKEVGATADGRLAYTPYGSSFSPAITTNLNGPLSVIQSFTKFDLRKIINGGPLTMEIHDSVFRNDIGIKKIAELVKIFIELGGHELQLNAINREKLIEAQKNPELYPNLIVRVWGWSGYFNELEVEFQNHIINRTEFC